VNKPKLLCMNMHDYTKQEQTKVTTLNYFNNIKNMTEHYNVIIVLFNSLQHSEITKYAPSLCNSEDVTIVHMYELKLLEMKQFISKCHLVSCIYMLGFNVESDLHTRQGLTVYTCNGKELRYVFYNFLLDAYRRRPNIVIYLTEKDVEEALKTLSVFSLIENKKVKVQTDFVSVIRTGIGSTRQNKNLLEFINKKLSGQIDGSKPFVKKVLPFASDVNPKYDLTLEDCKHINDNFVVFLEYYTTRNYPISCTRFNIQTLLTCFLLGRIPIIVCQTEEQREFIIELIKNTLDDSLNLPLNLHRASWMLHISFTILKSEYEDSSASELHSRFTKAGHIEFMRVAKDTILEIIQ